jgi:hypothetical protein
MHRVPAALLAAVFIGIAVVPLSIRAINAAVVGDMPDLGYLPALHLSRSHQPFSQETLDDLRFGNPRWVFIGDSMLGTRIDPRHLGLISGTRNEVVGFLFDTATGPAWWYLAFKNHVVASGVRPRATFVFFRDTNLTNTMFRLESLYGNALDAVARPPLERELDAIVAVRRNGPWHRLHDAIDDVYQSDFAQSWMEPALRRWFVRWKRPDPSDAGPFEWILVQTFGLDRIRHDVGTDMAAAQNPDFHRDLPSSVLPLMIDLSTQHGLPLCFVRVQRRPVGGRPPEQSRELRRYVADLKQWLESHGALFHDDTGDPEQTLDLYGDGDHVADKRRYTEIFRRRLDPLLRPAPAPGAP